MDGRRFRWCLYGGLLVSAVGCNRNTYPDNFGFPKPGQTVGAIPPPNGGGMFGHKTPAFMPNGQMTPAPGVAPNGMPVEVVEAKPKKSGKGFGSDTLVSFGDTWSQSAFADPPPPNRDDLIDKARQAYQKALQKDAKNKEALLGLARMYSRMGDPARATEHYKKYLDANPKDAEGHHEVALAHGQWKDWAGAVSWCEAALRLDPENRTYRKSLAFCQARAGRWEDAMATFCQMMPEAQARYNLARVLEHQKHTDMSRQQLQLALQADPAFAPAREFLADLDQGVRPEGLIPDGGDPNAIHQAGYESQR